MSNLQKGREKNNGNPWDWESGKGRKPEGREKGNKEEEGNKEVFSQIEKSAW